MARVSLEKEKKVSSVLDKMCYILQSEATFSPSLAGDLRGDAATPFATGWERRHKMGKQDHVRLPASQGGMGVGAVIWFYTGAAIGCPCFTSTLPLAMQFPR